MKVALIIYPEFSLYEVTPLTATLAINYDISVDIIASEMTVIKSEDNFQVMPHFSLDQINLATYDTILLTGTMAAFEILKDQKLLSELSKINLNKTTIAAISSSPLFLAKAGVLSGHRFTGGIYSNFLDYCTWLEKENYTGAHYYQDRNIITAVGDKSGVEGFTQLVLKQLGLITEDIELDSGKVSFDLSEEEFNSFLKEINPEVL
ncbi:DJ-1/PfpI family protein [Streptococcus hongkongensis]|nr:glutamine amidotransferase [Streptococcus uberis]